MLKYKVSSNGLILIRAPVGVVVSRWNGTYFRPVGDEKGRVIVENGQAFASIVAVAMCPRGHLRGLGQISLVYGSLGTLPCGQAEARWDSCIGENGGQKHRHIRNQVDDTMTQAERRPRITKGSHPACKRPSRDSYNPSKSVQTIAERQPDAASLRRKF
ncbi:hypothetical protein BD779DRAFT_1705258 [Infundibulicybe gibba]|nr:hypothetical protein BD779DRAFT_1705258 [Infundibulicybe gibba]